MDKFRKVESWLRFLNACSVFHQREARIEAQVFIAFLAYCLQVTMAQRPHALAPGLTPRVVLERHPAALGGPDQECHQRPLGVDQVAWVTQPAAVGSNAVFRLPHAAALLLGCAQ